MDEFLNSLEDVPSSDLPDNDYPLFASDSTNESASVYEETGKIFYFNYLFSLPHFFSQFSEENDGIFSQVFTPNREKILKLSEEKMKCQKYTAIQLVFIGNIIKTIIGQYVEELSVFFREKELNNTTTAEDNVGIGDDFEDEASSSCTFVNGNEIDDLSEEFLKLSI